MKRPIAPLVFAMLTAASLPAWACGILPRRAVEPPPPSAPLVAKNERTPSLHDAPPPDAAVLARAEALLESQLDGREAARLLVDEAVWRGDPQHPLVLAGRRLHALAASRNEAGAPPDWIVTTLRAAADRDADDPVLSADLAEVLSRTPEGQIEAFTRLTQLAEKGLLGGAHAWSALARLRLHAGDVEGSEEALSACRKVAADDAICVTPTAPPPAKKPAAPPRGKASPFGV